MPKFQVTITLSYWKYITDNSSEEAAREEAEDKAQEAMAEGTIQTFVEVEQVEDEAPTGDVL